MKTGRTLQELASELERQQEAKHDYLADTRRIRMEDDGKTLLLEGEGESDFERLMNRPVLFSGEASRHSHQQIASRVEIPMKYYERMQQEAPQLLARNVNHWFREQPERRMVRTLDGRVRAFLSERYRPLDNFDLAEVSLNQLSKMDCKLESCEVTEKHMYLKAVTDRLRDSVTVGDPVQAGIVISNSEVGCGSLRVEPLIYRLACLNGMIVADSAMRKYHIGRCGKGDEEGAREFFSDATRKADDKAFWMKVADTVTGALDEVQFGRAVSKLRAARENRIEDAQKTIELTADRFAWNEDEQASVLKHLISGADLSQYGLMNAITRASQDVDDYDRATDFERFGGQIVELPKKDWDLMKNVA